MKDKFWYECIDCGTGFKGDEIRYLCPRCDAGNRPGQPPRGILKIFYNYQKINNDGPIDTLFNSLKSDEFLPLLPLRTLESWPNLRIGQTPLYRLDPPALHNRIKRDLSSINADVGTSYFSGLFALSRPGFHLYVKEDSQNPTFSFKDRASALVSASAREQGVNTIITASTGNAGSSISGICAAQGQKSIVLVPASAPKAKLTQILMYGAQVIPVNGTYDHAFELSRKMTGILGIYNRNTAFNPLTIEGKKTVSFEIYQQLGHRVPDRVFVPTGDGVILSGVYKGFEDLMNLGIIDRIPVVVAVQSEGSCNLIRNLNSSEFTSIPSQTVADSISVDVPRCLYMARDYISKYRGEGVSVSDGDILRASRVLSGFTGIFAEPAATAAFAGMIRYWEQDLLPPESENVILLTGSGLKDPGAVQRSIRIPEAIEPETDAVERIVGKWISDTR